MPSRAVRIGALAGALSGGLSGCVEDNPKFVEPTATGGSWGATTGSPTAPTTDPSTTTSSTTATTTDETTIGETTDTTAPAMSTGVQPVCGDGVIDWPEECDNGPDNNDEAECTSVCELARCGDALVFAGVEDCDDADDDPADGCFGCIIPKSCRELADKGEEIGRAQPSGFYEIDVDGSEPIHLPMLVKCDMDSGPGGWTVIERSALDDPIGRPLFDPPPPPFNDTIPQDAPYRMRGKDIDKLVIHSDELRIDCGGSDFLLTWASEVKVGEGVMAPPCDVFMPVTYKAAQVKGVPYSGKLCTGVFGVQAMCEGAWHVSEQGQLQYACQGQLFPWADTVTPGANLFAVDPTIADELGPVHDCHKGGAIREIKLR